MNGSQRIASFLADFFAVRQTARNMDQISGAGYLNEIPAFLTI